MRSTRFRPRVDGLEDRLTPVAVVDFLSAAGQTAAGAAFFQAVAIDPDFVAGWNMKGVTLYYAKRYDEAFQVFHRALAIDAANALALKGQKMASDAMKAAR